MPWIPPSPGGVAPRDRARGLGTRHNLGRRFDDRDVAAGAEREAHLTAGRGVPGGERVRGGREDDVSAVPRKRQRHEMSLARAGRGYPYVGVAFQPGNRVSLALTSITHGISHVMEAMPRRRKHAQLALHNQPASNQVRTPSPLVPPVTSAQTGRWPGPPRRDRLRRRWLGPRSWNASPRQPKPSNPVRPALAAAKTIAGADRAYG